MIRRFTFDNNLNEIQETESYMSLIEQKSYEEKFEQFIRKYKDKHNAELAFVQNICNNIESTVNTCNFPSFEDIVNG